MIANDEQNVCGRYARPLLESTGTRIADVAWPAEQEHPQHLLVLAFGDVLSERSSRMFWDRSGLLERAVLERSCGGLECARRVLTSGAFGVVLDETQVLVGCHP